MAFTEFYVTTDGDNVNGGGTADYAPFYEQSNCSSAVDGLTITDDDGGGWDLASVGDPISISDGVGGYDYSLIQSISGNNITVAPAVTISLSAETCRVGGAWRDVDHAADTVGTFSTGNFANPPSINIKQAITGSYTNSVALSGSWNISVPLRLQGYIDIAHDMPRQQWAELTVSSGQCLDVSGGSFIQIRDLYLKSTGTGNAFDGGGGFTLYIENCKMENTTGSAVPCSIIRRHTTFNDCDIISSGTNTARGVDNVSGEHIMFLYCRFKNNETGGVDSMYAFCSFNGSNSGNGNAIQSVEGIWTLNCVFNNHTDDFITAGAGTDLVFVQNCSFNNTASGKKSIAYTGGGNCGMVVGRNNSFFNNAIDRGSEIINVDTNDDVTTNPGFTDPDNGDFSVSVSSPLANAGYPTSDAKGDIGGWDIGPYQIPLQHGAVSDYLENDILDTRLFSSTVYLALFSDSPQDDISGNELYGDGYARKIISFSYSVNGIADNDLDVTFGEATPNYWITITHLGIFDALTNGNLLFHGKFDSPIDVTVGDTLKVNAGDIVITLN